MVKVWERMLFLRDHTINDTEPPKNVLPSLLNDEAGRKNPRN